MLAHTRVRVSISRGQPRGLSGFPRCRGVSCLAASSGLVQCKPQLAALIVIWAVPNNVRTGKWADSREGDRGGDLISLVAYTEDKSQVDAARCLAKMLGVRP
jgi:hypothetical protein